MSLRLIFDGGCPFCQHFAELSERKGGLPRLESIDGRANSQLCQALKAQGYPISTGAILMAGLEGGDTWIFHGPAAITLLCGHLQPSAGLLRLLKAVFASRERTAVLYPLLLWARRLALCWRSYLWTPTMGPSGSQFAAIHTTVSTATEHHLRLMVFWTSLKTDRGFLPMARRSVRSLPPLRKSASLALLAASLGFAALAPTVALADTDDTEPQHTTWSRSAKRMFFDVLPKERSYWWPEIEFRDTLTEPSKMNAYIH